MGTQDKKDSKHLPPGMTEKTSEFLNQKQQDQAHQSAQHQYPVDDKRKDARREHTNGSTPRRDQ